MNKQTILFLYLNTGNGHYSIALNVKKAIEEEPFYKKNGSILFEHGFNPSLKATTRFFEGGYRLTTKYAPGLYSLFYDINCNPLMLDFTRFMTVLGNYTYLKNYIKKNNVTKIVSFHFAVSAIIDKIILREHLSIPFITVVTDPVTAHPSWFLSKRSRYVFFTQQLALKAQKKYGIKNAVVMPFPVSKKFFYAREKNLGLAIRNRMGITKDDFHLLIAGGGEGLPGAYKIVKYFCKKNAPIHMSVVCGRNKELYRLLDILKKLYPSMHIKNYGFIDSMSECMNSADCIISKGGSSTVFESLVSKKPLIISQYIHGQELGNVQYVKESGYGWFLRKPQSIYAKVMQLKNDGEYRHTVEENIKNMYIADDIKKIAQYIIEE